MNRLFNRTTNRANKTRNGETIFYINNYYEVNLTTGEVTTDRKFTGQRLDGTGLYYYGARGVLR